MKKKKINKTSGGSAETFPTQLGREDHFKCPIWFADAPKFVDDLNKASDSYIETAKKNLKKEMLESVQKYYLKDPWLYFLDSCGIEYAQLKKEPDIV